MLPGQFSGSLPGPQATGTEFVLRRTSSFHRVLGFTGKTIDDIVNCPIAKRTVLGYFKLHRFVERSSEITDLERQWNPLRR